MQWYYTKQGQQFGPIDEAELHRLAQRGEITPDDLVWNPTFGDKWVPASSIETLFASPPRMTPPTITGEYSSGADRVWGNTPNRDLMQMARESLRTHWGLGVGVVLLNQIIVSVPSQFIPMIGLLLAGPMAVGVCLVFLSLARRQQAEVGQLFSGFSRFGTALGGYLLMCLFILLWTLLLIIPGIIASYAYSMTFFIMADDPSVKASDAITRSKEMMRGNKWKLFCLYWRFFWWILLCILTLGIGFLWLMPYMQASLAHFYEDVKGGEGTGMKRATPHAGAAYQRQ